MRLISLLFYKELLCVKSFRNCLWLSFLYQIPTKMSLAKKTLTSKFENVEDTREMLVLECILERLPQSSLCQMASVCHSLRERCVSTFGRGTRSRNGVELV
uniref:F-box domain-containing protein n=1 Tax=Lotus japonicus TaxID=34305 RepID=I3SD63_LOTJA|nr:unknown [Lotus japonicus]